MTLTSKTLSLNSKNKRNNNKKIDITEDEKQKVEEYVQSLAEYNKAVEKIKEEN